MGIKKFLKFWFPVLLYSGIIFWASSVSQSDMPVHIGRWDKTIHLIEYLPFGFLLIRALKNTGREKSFMVIFIMTVLGAFLYGLSDEFHQWFVPGRSPSWMDVFADTVGGSLGGFIGLIGIRLRKFKQEQQKF